MRHTRHGAVGLGHSAQGFTLLEVMVVLVIIALVTGLVALRIQPDPQQQLRMDGERLSLWLEAVRAQSRVQGRPAQARVTAQGVEVIGLTQANQAAPRLNWLSSDTRPALPESLLWLGPEPILAAQKLTLVSVRDPSTSTVIWTNGLGPWALQP
jgi:general secretion pathway protein H